MQRLCGIAEPCYGAIFARQVHDRRAELRARDYCRLGVETEIVFRLGEDVPHGGDAERVAAAVESAAAAIELIEDLRYDYRRLDAAAMVAGNVWNAGVVLAAPVKEWRALDLARVRAAAPTLPFLVPGIGEQGGSAGEAVRAGRRADGRGLVVSASRSVLYAGSDANIRKAAEELHSELAG